MLWPIILTLNLKGSWKVSTDSQPIIVAGAGQMSPTDGGHEARIWMGLRSEISCCWPLFLTSKATMRLTLEGIVVATVSTRVPVPSARPFSHSWASIFLK